MQIALFAALALVPLIFVFSMWEMRKHPRGLYVLFFAEMWERFSYYGMRALLIFYLTWHFLYDSDFSLTLYGAYVALVYLGPLLGGWLADKYIGFRKAVTFGAVLLVAGHGLMGFHGPPATERLVTDTATYQLERPTYSETRDEREIMVDGTAQRVHRFIDPQADSRLLDAEYTATGDDTPSSIRGVFDELDTQNGRFRGEVRFIAAPEPGSFEAIVFGQSNLYAGMRAFADQLNIETLNGELYVRTADPTARDVVFTPYLTEADIRLAIAESGSVFTNVREAVEALPVTRLEGTIERQRSSTHETILFAALALIVAGVGFLKPNISTCVGALYEQNDRRRDSGFTLYYMGINLGSFLAGIACGWAAANYGWSLGFGLAAIGMLAGLVMFVLGQGWLEGRADPPAGVDLKTPVFAGLNREWLVYLSGLAFAGVAFILLQFSSFTSAAMYPVFGLVTAGIVFYMLTRLDAETRNSMIGLLILSISSVLFWTLFDQGPTSLNLFAGAHVTNEIGGQEFPATYLQSANPYFIIVFAPLVAALWAWLGNRGWEPNAFIKFGFGMVQIGAGFYILNFGIQTATADAEGALRISVLFIILMYLLHTTGEIFLSPVGLSAVTKMSAPQIVGFMMGYWFLASSFANVIAAEVAKRTQVPEGAPTAESLAAYNAVYLQLGSAAVGLGAALILFSPWLRKLSRKSDDHTRAMEVDASGVSLDRSGARTPGE